MAKKKKKSAKKGNTPRRNNGSSMIPVAVAVVVILAVVAVSLWASGVIPPVYTFAALAVCTYPVTVSYLMKLNQFADSPKSIKVFIPFLGESGSFLSRGLEIAHNVLLLLCAIGVVSMVGGRYVNFLSIPNLIGTLIYGGADVMNNGVVLNLFVYQTYFILACYALLCVVRGIAYWQIDLFIAKESSRIYLMESSRRKRSGNAKSNEKHWTEYLMSCLYFFPVLRVLSLMVAMQRLNKLVVFNDMTMKTKTRTERVVVEMEDDHYE